MNEWNKLFDILQVLNPQSDSYTNERKVKPHVPDNIVEKYDEERWDDICHYMALIKEVLTEGETTSNVINHNGQISIKWSKEDVIEQAKNSDTNLTDKEVDQVLYRLFKFHDASVGISWDTIDWHIADVVSERKGDE